MREPYMGAGVPRKVELKRHQMEAVVQQLQKVDASQWSELGQEEWREIMNEFFHQARDCFPVPYSDD